MKNKEVKRNEYNYKKYMNSVFDNNLAKKVYEELINNAKISYKVRYHKYTERHHIIPKCLGGSNKVNNIVRLTYGEHLFAHYLLCIINYPNSGLIYAFKRMTQGSLRENNDSTKVVLKTFSKFYHTKVLRQSYDINKLEKDIQVYVNTYHSFTLSYLCKDLNVNMLHIRKTEFYKEYLNFGKKNFYCEYNKNKYVFSERSRIINKENKYRLKEDKYSKHEDKYSQKKDIYSKGEDIYSIKFQKICNKINELLENKDFIQKRELNLSRRTWENLIKRKEFLKDFVNKHGKIYKR